MKTTVIYLRGYPGNEPSDKADSLPRELGDEFEVLAPLYDASRPGETFKNLCDTVERLISAGEDVLLAGTSLGGFFANALSNKYKLPVLLVNPSLNPHLNLVKYGLSTVILNSYAYLWSMAQGHRARAQKIVILGMEDEVINHDWNGELLHREAAIVRLNGEGHRLSTITPIVDSIRWLNNQLIDN